MNALYAPATPSPSGPAMRTLLAASLTVLVILLTSPAVSLADWQYTKWGMSPDEAIASSGGSLRKATSEDVKKRALPGPNRPIPGAVGVISIMECDADVTLYFRKDSLEYVDVGLCKNLVGKHVLRELLAKYGTPAMLETSRASLDTTSAFWQDIRGNKSVYFFTSDTTRMREFISMIQYAPISSAWNSSL